MFRKEQVAALSEVGFLAARWNALIAEGTAAIEMFNLIGKVWTGQVIQAAQS